MIKLIVFDLDGVLVTTKELHYYSLNKSLEAIDEKYVISLNEHHEIYDGLPTKRKLDLLTKNKGLPKEYHEQIYRDKQKYTFDLIREKIKRDDRLIQVVKQLKLDGYVVYVASNAIRETVKLLLYYTGIMEYVDYFISNEDVLNSKPNSEIYLKCMVHAGVNPDETLIVEDSPRGIESAQNARAHLMVVKNPDDVTYEKIIDEIKGNITMKKESLKLNNLNILVPMAGAGSRFAQAGFTFPKPLIEVKGKPMIQLVVENLGFKAKYIYVVRKEHYEKYNLKHLLNLITPDCEIVQVDHLTEGAACTTLLAKEYINTEDSLIIANSDQFIEWNPTDFYYKMVETRADGGILTFKSVHPKWSFVRLDENENVVEVAEKRPISDNATCLHYNTSVLMSDGSKKLLGKLVNNRSEEYVKTFNEKTGVYENKKITGWVKKLDISANWFELSFIDNRNSKMGLRRIHITGDHEVLTKNGRKRVDLLTENDKILTIYKKPNYIQREFIDGTILGDGYYARPNKYGEMGRLKIKQSRKQEEWFYLKQSILNQFGGFGGEEKEGIRKIQNRAVNSSGSLMHSTSSNPVFSFERDRWYRRGTKQVPSDIVLSPITLATWYMDDGSLSSSEERLVLCTDSFDDESINILRNKLLKLNISTKIWRLNKGKSQRLIISGMSAFNFFDLISKYVIPSMQYKLPIHFRGEFDVKNWDLGAPIPYYSSVLVSKIDFKDIKSKHPHLYCLEVEDNHNFVAGDMLVSNCGIYYYKQGSDYVKYAEQMIEKDIRVNGEFYVAPVYNEFILDKKRIKIYNIKKMWGLGDPDALKYFMDNYDRM
jgi:HAD superfamily hydrolase (TIGR01509 family)